MIADLGMKEGVEVFFFFKQKTAYEIGTGDWSSDVCSSDLLPQQEMVSIKSGVLPQGDPAVKNSWRCRSV